MDELRILIARLGWPSTSARWWTMQELAARLGQPAERIETESALLQLLRSCKLEAEVVETLCIFWIAAQGPGYSTSVDLSQNIPRPSLLSDQLMSSLGLFVKGEIDGLVEVPEDFVVPEDFKGVQGADLPRIFKTSMRRLEARYKLPFVGQMAFEWSANHSCYADAPYQGDPWHFTRPLGDGFVGQYSARAALRSISAYLRALAVGKQLWGIPDRQAIQMSLLALPLHPTFALMRPRRPKWFPTPENAFSSDSESVESALRILLARLENERPGDNLLAFSSPVQMAMGECIEVNLVRWVQSAGSNIGDNDLAEHLNAFWTREQMLPTTAPEPFSTTTMVRPFGLDELMDEECKGWPLAGTLDFERMGYLQHDLYPKRLFFPTLPDSSEYLITPSEGSLEVRFGEQVIADFCYWNAGWGPARPRRLGGDCGTALVSRGTGYREAFAPAPVPLRVFYLWQVRTLSRSDNFREFSETVITGAMFV